MKKTKMNSDDIITIILGLVVLIIVLPLLIIGIFKATILLAIIGVAILFMLMTVAILFTPDPIGEACVELSKKLAEENGKREEQ